MSAPDRRSLDGHDFENLLVEHRGAALWLRLNRPAARNALSPTLVRELWSALDAAEKDPCRVLVLSGEGPSFCAGADLKASDGVGGTAPNGVGGTAPNGVGGTAHDGAHHPFAKLLLRLQSFPKPIIAAVNGPAYGGGIGLVAVADVAVAAKEAVFSFSEVKLGLVPAMISVFVLPKIGSHQARRLFLTGRRFSAAEAVHLGLIHETTADGTLNDLVAREVHTLVQGGPEAQTAIKALVRDVPTMTTDAALHYASGLLAERAASDEGQEGINAFRRRRAPSWIESSGNEEDSGSEP